MNIYISDLFRNRCQPRNEQMTTARFFLLLDVGHHPDELPADTSDDALIIYVSSLITESSCPVLLIVQEQHTMTRSTYSPL